ncbi:hypothetical protein HKX48_000694 [Thoreauomyces humboldtii]|nr:hypothetical protein HKX48_000694 [Thoreauomyces humboldtii]
MTLDARKKQPPPPPPPPPMTLAQKKTQARLRAAERARANRGRSSRDDDSTRESSPPRPERDDDRVTREVSSPSDGTTDDGPLVKRRKLSLTSLPLAYSTPISATTTTATPCPHLHALPPLDTLHDIRMYARMQARAYIRAELDHEIRNEQRRALLLEPDHIRRFPLPSRREQREQDRIRDEEERRIRLLERMEEEEGRDDEAAARHVQEEEEREVGVEVEVDVEVQPAIDGKRKKKRRKRKQDDQEEEDDRPLSAKQRGKLTCAREARGSKCERQRADLCFASDSEHFKRERQRAYSPFSWRAKRAPSFPCASEANRPFALRAKRALPNASDSEHPKGPAKRDPVLWLFPPSVLDPSACFTSTRIPYTLPLLPLASHRRHPPSPSSQPASSPPATISPPSPPSRQQSSPQLQPPPQQPPQPPLVTRTLAYTVTSVPAFLSDGVPLSHDYKPYLCEAPDCERRFKKLNGLIAHHYSAHVVPEDLEDDPEAVESGRPFKCNHEGCENRYKNSNGLAYHLENAHGTTHPNARKSRSSSTVSASASSPAPFEGGTDAAMSLPSTPPPAPSPVPVPAVETKPIVVATPTSHKPARRGSAAGGPERPWNCPYKGCEKTYKNLKGLAYHLQKATATGHMVPTERLGGLNMYICAIPACGKTYKTPQFLVDHVEAEHADMEPIVVPTVEEPIVTKIVECPACLRPFKSHKGLAEHTALIHHTKPSSPSPPPHQSFHHDPLHPLPPTSEIYTDHHRHDPHANSTPPSIEKRPRTRSSVRYDDEGRDLPGLQFPVHGDSHHHRPLDHLHHEHGRLGHQHHLDVDGGVGFLGLYALANYAAAGAVDEARVVGRKDVDLEMA